MLCVDVIVLLCFHLDFDSLVSFAAACPQWAAVIYRHIERNMRHIVLKLTLSSTSTLQPAYRNNAEFCTRKLLCTNQETISKVEYNPDEFTIMYQTVQSETERSMVDERVLPKYVWGHMPLHIIIVNSVEFFEVHGTPIPQDVCDFLENLETGHVSMTVKERANARRVLSALRLRPGSELDIYQNHKTTDGEPFLQYSQLTLFKTICYCNAEAWTMASVLWQHLETSNHVIIDAEAWYFCYLEWLEGTLEDYVKCKAGAVRVTKTELPMPNIPVRFEVERVNRSEALRPTGGARKIRASGWDEWHDFRGRRRDIFVNLIVENSV